MKGSAVGRVRLCRRGRRAEHRAHPTARSAKGIAWWVQGYRSAGQR